jgi:hypothetical protein
MKWQHVWSFESFWTLNQGRYALHHGIRMMWNACERPSWHCWIIIALGPSLGKDVLFVFSPNTCGCVWVCVGACGRACTPEWSVFVLGRCVRRTCRANIWRKRAASCRSMWGAFGVVAVCILEALQDSPLQDFPLQEHVTAMSFQIAMLTWYYWNLRLKNYNEIVWTHVCVL